MKMILEKLDRYYFQMQSDDVHAGVNGIATELAIQRRSVSNEDWNTNWLPTIKSHRLHSLLQEDPYTDRANKKPRGYAGDAVMLDYMYFNSPPSDTSEIGIKNFRNDDSVSRRLSCQMACLSPWSND